VASPAKDVIALSGAKEGEIGQFTAVNNPQEADALLQYWMRFPGRLSIWELQRTSRPNDEEYSWHAAVDLAVKLDCPVVATNDVRFLKREDLNNHETRVCIGEGPGVDDASGYGRLQRRTVS